MSKLLKIGSLFLALALGFSSCKKDEAPEPVEPTQPFTVSDPTPTPSDAAGVMVAIETSNYINVPFVGETNTPIGTAVAVFGNLQGGTFVDAGLVKVDAKELNKQTNNSYVLIPSAAAGLSYEPPVVWEIAGSSANGVAQITYSNTNEFPTGPKYDGPTNIPRNAAFTLTSAVAISGADSIIYNVIAQNNTIASRTVAGNIASVTFTAAEMGALNAGSAYIQIVPYNMASEEIGGKKYYFINQAVTTKSVTLN
jgi:hypothetical protein